MADLPEILIQEELSFQLDKKHSVYVSKRGNVEHPVVSDSESESDEKENALLEKLAKAARERYKKPVLVNAVDAVHYGFVNGNHSLYHMDSIKKNAKTFVEPFNKPVLIHHRASDGMFGGQASDPVGRIVKANPIAYDLPKQQRTDSTTPKGHITVYSVIPDKDALEKIMDDRYMTVSIGAGVDVSQVRCSICGKNPFVRDRDGNRLCDHYRGESYRPMDNDGKEGEAQTCHYIFYDKTYKEYSFVNTPADVQAVNRKIVYVGDSLGMKDMKNWKETLSDKVNPLVALYIGEADQKDNQRLTNIMGEEISIKDILSPSFKCVGDLCSINSPGPVPVVPKSNSTSSLADAEVSDKTNNGGKAVPCNCIDRLLDNYAGITTIQSLIHSRLWDNVADIKSELSGIDLIDTCAVDALSTLDEIESFLRDQLDEIEDTKLKTRSRRNLHDTAFCGPGRSFPVPDRAHVNAARRLIDKINIPATLRAGIIDKINQQAKLFGNSILEDIEQTVQDQVNANPEAQMSKWNFETKDEILGCNVVTSHIADIKAEHSKQLADKDALIEKLTAQVKDTMISEIIDVSVEAKLAKVKAIVDATSEDAKKSAIDSYRKELSAKSTDVLSELLAFAKDELAARPKETTKDPVTQQLADQLNKTPASQAAQPADAPATPAGTTDQQEPSDPAVVNNPPAAPAAQDTSKVPSIMDAFGKPVA